MDVGTIIQFVITQGGVAGFAIWMLVKAYQDKEALLIQSKAESDRYILAYHEVILLLIAAQDKATDGYSTLTGKIDALATESAAASQRQETWQHEERAAKSATPPSK